MKKSIHSKIGIRSEDFDLIINVINQFNEVKNACVFGSRAIGNFKKGSDIDLCLFGNNIDDRDITRISYLLNNEIPLPYFFDVIDFKKINNPSLKKHITSYGVNIL